MKSSKTVHLICIHLLLAGFIVTYNNCDQRKVAFEQKPLPEPEPTVDTVSVEPKEKACFTDQFQQPAAAEYKKIDILFVSDSSGSSSSERGQIISEINAFLDQLPAGSDYQFAVLIGYGSQGSKAGKLEQRNNEPHVLASATMALAEIQTELTNKLSTQPGETNSDNGEQGLYSLYHLLQPDNLALAKSQGFFRDDAGLAVIFLSDENDICMPSNLSPDQEVALYNKDCLDPPVTPQTVHFSALKTQEARPLAIAGIIYTDPNTVPGGGRNEVGYGYLETIALDQGKAIDLANADFVPGLIEIGKLVSQRLRLRRFIRFNNQQVQVNQDTISVTVDGVEVTDFTFDPVSVAVSLGTPGEALSEIEISYCEL